MFSRLARTAPRARSQRCEGCGAQWCAVEQPEQPSLPPAPPLLPPVTQPSPTQCFEPAPFPSPPCAPPAAPLLLVPAVPVVPVVPVAAAAAAAGQAAGVNPIFTWAKSGACRTNDSNKGNAYEELWGASKSNCHNRYRCLYDSACTGFEHASYPNGKQRCKLFSDAIVSTVPVPGAECYMKAPK